MARYTYKDENGRYYIESKNGLLESDIKGRVFGKAIDRFAEFENAPTEDVAEVKHGKWIKVYCNKKTTVYECSCCGHLTLGTSDYCICGAKMDGERKENEL